MEIKGRVHSVGQVVTFKTANGKEFKKRELVIDASRFDPNTGEKVFDNFPCIEFTGDKTNLLDNLILGQVVAVSFDLQGREYVKDGVTKNVTTARGYRLEARPIQDVALTPTEEELF